MIALRSIADLDCAKAEFDHQVAKAGNIEGPQATTGDKRGTYARIRVTPRKVNL